MKRRLLALPAAAMGALVFLPTFAGQASAIQYPPITPPGVVQPPPVNQNALDNTTTACYMIEAHNPITSQSPQTVGAYAFLTRGETFCPFIDW